MVSECVCTLVGGSCGKKWREGWKAYRIEGVRGKIHSRLPPLPPPPPSTGTGVATPRYRRSAHYAESSAETSNREPPQIRYTVSVEYAQVRRHLVFPRRMYRGYPTFSQSSTESIRYRYFLAESSVQSARTSMPLTYIPNHSRHVLAATLLLCNVLSVERFHFRCIGI